MNSYLKAGDTVNGREGSVSATINGDVYNLLEITKLEANVEKETTDIHVLGKRTTQVKSKGFKCSGSAEGYYVSSKMAEIMEQYVKTGVETYFTIIVTNEDKTTSLGQQRVQLNNVVIKNYTIAQVDVESDVLKCSFDFDFEDFDILKSFDRPDYFD